SQTTVCGTITLGGVLHNVVGQYWRWRIGGFIPTRRRRSQPIAHKLFVKGVLGLAGLIRCSVPEPRRIWSEHFIAQRDNPVFIQSVFDFSIGQDNTGFSSDAFCSYVQLQGLSRMASAVSEPIRAVISAKLIFSSWSPTAALADGVKIAGSSFEPSSNPVGNWMPVTVPFWRYSASPEPVR